MKRLLCLFLALCAPLLATDIAYSPPMGGMTITVQAGQTSSVSLPLIHASVGTGLMLARIDSIASSNAINVPTAGWTPGGLSTAATPYYLRIRTGALAGRLFLVSTSGASQNTATQVIVNNDGTDLTAAGLNTGTSGDAFELVLADTLGSLFGSNTLQGGPDATTADNVLVWGGASWQVFYYNTTNSKWQLRTDTAASPARDGFVLRPDRGIMITRYAATPLSMRVTGRVPTVAPQFFHTRPGLTFLSNGLPVDMTLGSLALQTNATGWVAGTNPATSTVDSDLLQVWGGASWQVFYFDSGTGFWRFRSDSTPINRNNFLVPAGRPMMIRRLTAGANIGENNISLPLPYTISM